MIIFIKKKKSCVNLDFLGWNLDIGVFPCLVRVFGGLLLLLLPPPWFVIHKGSFTHCVSLCFGRVVYWFRGTSCVGSHVTGHPRSNDIQSLPDCCFPHQLTGLHCIIIYTLLPAGLKNNTVPYIVHIKLVSELQAWSVFSHHLRS